LKFAVASALAVASLAAHGQEAAATTELETIIVTGTYIKGTAEDAALPVDVITIDDLEKQGSPSMTELVRSIPAVQGIIGESNQFGVSQAAGSSNVNLRGLGSARTLVLLNGKRLAPSPAVGVSIDTNLLPIAAIGRVEVLKDGAAATYGSDAIGGVVNFITKEKFEGFLIEGAYSYIDGTDGEYNASVSWGWRGDSSDALLAAGFRHRSNLPTLERDWAVKPRSFSPEGGWSGFSNPGTFTALTAGSLPIAPTAGNPFGGSIIDPACSVLGGTPVPTCTFQYTAYENLVEEEDHFNVYGEYNVEFAGAIKLHLEGLWAMHDVPEEFGSPSYGPNQGPRGATSSELAPTYFIPFVSGNPALSNPGLTALYPYLGATQQGLINTSAYFNSGATGSAGLASGIVVSGLQWRPFAQGGNVATGGPQKNSRQFDSFRVAFSLSGDVGDLFSWNTGATYSETGSEISTPDFLVSRLQLALRGLGGANCTGTTPGANGCLWLNPFSTAIPNNPALGLTNTLTYTPGTANDPELVRWITSANSYDATVTLLTVDAVLNGELSSLALPGGNVGWAVGTQYREQGYELVVTDPFADATLTPCPQSPVNPAATCLLPSDPTLSPPGALSFYGPTKPRDVTQDVIAGFAELSMPILENLSAQLAVRYEDYGGNVGATTNPKLSMRYQPFQALTLRASGGTTFRAPPETSLSGATTFLFFTPQAGGYKPVDTVGNPNLKPETADTFNVGFIVTAAGFTGSVDYWKFKFKDALTAEVGTQLVTAMYSSYTDSLGVLQYDHCSDPAYAGLLTRFTFTATGCHNPGYNPTTGATTGANALAATLLRTRVNQINAQSDVDVSGLDISAAYRFSDVGGGNLIIGVDGTYNFEYKLGDNYVEGILIDPAVDAIGTRGGRGGSLPQWKGAAYLDFSFGISNLRWTTRYMDGVEDVRVATFATNTNGKNVDAFITHDIAYRATLDNNVTFGLAVINVLDEAPPFARLDLNYDPFLANPLGRYIKASAGVKF
jgi:iron complex outermembrane receptor protein